MNTTTELIELTNQWKAAKQAVKDAQGKLLDIEVKLYEQVRDRLKPEGTNNFEGGLKVITGYNYKCDDNKLDKIYSGLSDQDKDQWPFKHKWSPSVPKLRQFMLSHTNIISDAVTISERKPTFSVGDIADDN